jgi:CheY-like chemotaxis protein/DNA-binding Xre family transcriptional regulator
MGISQETLAERASLHRTYIAGIEGGGRNVTLKSIEKLARALQISTSDLLFHAAGRNGPADGETSNGDCVDILMVEDNQADAELTLRAFKRARITNSVQIVHDGEEALDYLFSKGRFARRKTQGQPQLVLLDLNLPRTSGLEVLRRIRMDKTTQKLPVVILTASQDDRDIGECHRLGVENYIVKPVDFPGLIKVTPRLNLNWTLLKPSGAKHRPAREHSASGAAII